VGVIDRVLRNGSVGSQFLATAREEVREMARKYGLPG
jgi:hypothetical protein